MKVVFKVTDASAGSTRSFDFTFVISSPLRRIPLMRYAVVFLEPLTLPHNFHVV